MKGTFKIFNDQKFINNYLPSGDNICVDKKHDIKANVLNDV